LHRNGKRKGLNALTLKPGRYLLDYGFVIERRIRIWSSVRGFGWICANLTMNPVQPLCLVIIRRELMVGNRPCGGDASCMFEFSKISFAKAQHCRPIHLAAAPHVVVGARTERLAGFVEPGLLGHISLFGENRVNVPILRFLRQVVSPL
jgi:hypothetical protein